jgi:tRNA(Ile)-lysidine synthase
MNEDERFARVKIRKQLMPVMQTFNKRVVEALSRTATLLRDDGAVLFTSSGDLLQKAEQASANETETKVPPLSVNVLAGAPPALRRRAIREWISKGRGGNTRRLEMVHLLAVERLVGANQGGKVVELPNGYRVRRKLGYLEFEAESN